MTAETRVNNSNVAVNTSYAYDAADRETTITDWSLTSMSGGSTSAPLATYVYSWTTAYATALLVAGVISRPPQLSG